MMFSLLIGLLIVDIALGMFLSKKTEARIAPSEWALIPERGWIEHHPTLGWFNRPNVDTYFKNGTTTAPLHTNASGYRGTRDYPVPRNSKNMRILLLGDSFTFGWGVGNEETFGAQLEQMHPDWEVINLAVAGYGIDQITLSYEVFGKAHKPDWTLICLYPEDFWRATRAYTDGGYAKPYFKLQKNEKLALMNVPVPKMHAQNLSELTAKQFPPVIDRPWWIRLVLRSTLVRYARHKVLRIARDLGYIDPELTEEWKLGKYILSHALELLHADGVKTLVVLIPPNRWMTNTKETSEQKTLTRFAEREGFAFLDLTPPLQEMVRTGSISDYYLEGDEHWTARSHRLAAQLLDQHLQKNP